MKRFLSLCASSVSMLLAFINMVVILITLLVLSVVWYILALLVPFITIFDFMSEGKWDHWFSGIWYKVVVHCKTVVSLWKGIFNAINN